MKKTMALAVAAMLLIVAFPESAAAGSAGKRDAKEKTTITKKLPKRGGYPFCQNGNSKIQLPALARAGVRLQLKLDCWSAVIEIPDIKRTISVDYEPARGVKTIDLFVWVDGRELRGTDLSDLPAMFRARGSGVLLIIIKDIEEIAGVRVQSI